MKEKSGWGPWTLFIDQFLPLSVIITSVAPHFKSIEIVLLLQTVTTSAHFSSLLFIWGFEKLRKKFPELKKKDLELITSQMQNNSLAS